MNISFHYINIPLVHSVLRFHSILLFILVFASLSIAMCSGYSPYSANDNNNIKIQIRFTLQDGSPLSNASITLKPSRVSTVKLVNTTDHDGYAVFRVDESYLNSTYRPVISVSYGVYGVIYEETYSSFNDIPSNIILPYTVLNTTINVTDEYLEKINGSYTLSYNGHKLVEGEYINGSIKIEGFDMMGLYLLWSTTGGDLNDGYTLTIDVPQGIHESYKLIDAMNGIMIDVYPPKLMIENFNYQYIENAHVIYFYITITGWDGVNTEDLSFNIAMKLILGNNSIDLKSELVECTIHDRNGLIVKTCRYKSWFSIGTVDPNTINAIEYSVTAIDPASKKTTINGNESIKIGAESNGSGISVNTTTTTTPFQPTMLIATTSRGNQSAGFSPPSSGGRKNMHLPFSIYYLGPLLGVIVLFIELRSHRVE